jgi:hypothetical protein
VFAARRQITDKHILVMSIKSWRPPCRHVCSITPKQINAKVVIRGPNWIHGTKNNPILDLVNETGTATHSWGDRQVTFDPEGKLIPEAEATECNEHLWEIIGKAFKHSNANSASIPSDQSLMNYITHHAEGKFRESFPEAYQSTASKGQEELKHELLLKMADMWGAFIGGTTDKQSLKFLWLEECLDGENLFCAGTYAKVLDLVSKPALERADVKLNHQVSKIISREEDGNPKVTVETACGVREMFDEVVVTVPLGWLKRRKEIFVPALPERISQAIDSLGYGNLDKVSPLAYCMNVH